MTDLNPPPSTPAAFLRAFVSTKVVVAPDVAVGSRRAPALDAELQQLVGLLQDGRAREDLVRDLTAAAREAREARLERGEADRRLTLADVEAAVKAVRRRG